MVFPYVWIFRISEWLLSRLRCASFSFLGGGQDQILIFTLETCCVHRILADWKFSIWPILDLEKGAVQCNVVLQEVDSQLTASHRVQQT